MNAAVVDGCRYTGGFELTGADALARLREPATKRTIRRIEVVDASLPPGDSDRLERRLNRWYFACGCEQGSTVVLLTLLASTVAGALAGFDGPFRWWRIVAYLLAAALVGKGLGLAYAKVRLHRLYGELELHYRGT